MISLIMSIYIGDDFQHLEQCLDSVARQSRLPDDFVIVCDGPINELQNRVLLNFVEQVSFDVNIVRLPENVGRSEAKNIGVLESKFELIAIMDSDDIMSEDRLRRQFDILSENPKIGLCCSLSTEFEDSLDVFFALKRCPEYSGDINARMKFSCCVCNPSVMMRKSLFIGAGGYPDLRLLNEDYLLFLRMLKMGVQFYCIQDSLIFVRVGAAQRRRRSGIRLFIQDLKFRIICLSEGLIGWRTFFMVVPLFFLRRIIPASISRPFQLAWRRIS